MKEIELRSSPQHIIKINTEGITVKEMFESMYISVAPIANELDVCFATVGYTISAIYSASTSGYEKQNVFGMQYIGQYSVGNNIKRVPFFEMDLLKFDPYTMCLVGNKGCAWINFEFSNLNKPLTQEEKDFIVSCGWKFASENYVYIPDDYDGCMASGIENIRKLLTRLKEKEACNESTKYHN